MRQVNREELIWMVMYALQRLPASTKAMMTDRRHEQEVKGRFFAAQRIAEHLGRLEILSDAPEPPPFRMADVEGGTGVPAVDG